MPSSNDPNLSQNVNNTRLFIVSAPSGTGKTSLNKKLVDAIPTLSVAISHTTRQTRDNEIDGKDYFFIDNDTFIHMRDNGDFVEHAEVFQHYYGTSRQSIESILAKGNDVILEIDWQGAQQVRAQFPHCVSIFILPPSLKDLEARLSGRNQDHPEIIQRRLAEAKSEISHYNEYNYLIINDSFDKAFEELRAIIQSPANSPVLETGMHEHLLKELGALDH